MPVTLDLGAPAKTSGKGKAPTPVQEAVDACLTPQDKQMGLVALGVWLALLVVVSGIWWFFESTYLTFGVGIPLWCLLAIGAYLFVGPNYLMGKLQSTGSANTISSAVKPLIKTMISKAAPVLALAEPRAFLSEAQAPRARVWPKALVFNKPLFNIVSDNEAAVLALRGLAHQRLGHARRLALLDLLDQTPRLTRLLVWPVALYARFLRQFWLPHAHKSADRLALLLVRNASVMQSAILKEYAANDQAMQDFSITSEDVTKYIAQNGFIGMKGEEISTQYKLGRAIHEAPILEDRIQSLVAWSTSAGFKEAAAKLESSIKR